MERNWINKGSVIERTPQALAAALNSHAENWDEMKSRFPAELREDAYCILLTSEDKPVETLLYFRDEILAMHIHLRSKVNPNLHIGSVSIGPIIKIESAVHSSGFRGVVFTIPEDQQVFVLQNGFVKADMLFDP